MLIECQTVWIFWPRPFSLHSLAMLMRFEGFGSRRERLGHNGGRNMPSLIGRA